MRNINIIKIILFLFLAISIFFFVLGLTFPIMSTKKSILGIGIDYQEIHLFDSVTMFWEAKEYFLAIIILLFTIVLPVVKYLDVLIRIASSFEIPEKLGKFLHAIDKWSMLDVFLVALLILNFKLDSSFIVMKIKIGTTFLTVSIILRMALVMIISRFEEKQKIKQKRKRNKVQPII
jgi:paraquat-inducible protein A